MTIENQNEAVNTVPESGVTATPEDVINTQAPEETPEPKTFTQEELDAQIGKRLAKERRKWERDQQAAQESQRPAPRQDAPKPEQFATPEDYAEAYSEWKIADQQERQHRTKIDSSFEDRVESAREKYNDFDEVAYRQPQDGGPAISREMAQVIKESEVGPELAYYLGKNPKESKRIFELSPLAQARELGKIEASLSSNPPAAKKTSSAPEPIKPVGSRSSTPTYDPSDPRSSSMSTSDWIAARNKQLSK